MDLPPRGPTMLSTTTPLSLRLSSSSKMASHQQQQQPIDPDDPTAAWIAALKTWEAVRDRPLTDRSRRAARDTVRRLVPHGVPADLRAVVWQKMLGVDNVLRADAVLEVLLAREPLPIYEQIERDIGRTFPHHVHFKDPSSPGQVQLASVLKAFAQYNPAVGYTQGMNFITGLLLLHMPPEEALPTLIALLATPAFPHHTADLTHMHAFCALIDRVLPRHLPALAKYMTEHDVSAIAYIPRWWMSGWEVCPWGCRVRVWDCAVVEGVVGVVKAVIALLGCIQDHLLATHGSELLDVLLHPLARDLLPDRLTREYLKLESVIDDASIRKLAAKVEKECGLHLLLAPSMAHLASSTSSTTVSTNAGDGTVPPARSSWSLWGSRTTSSSPARPVPLPPATTAGSVASGSAAAVVSLSSTEDQGERPQPQPQPTGGPSSLVARWLGGWSNGSVASSAASQDLGPAAAPPPAVPPSTITDQVGNEDIVASSGV
ncbi:rab-GTPase-TBC domain-containing protein [Blastocladiella britannica]|nr:rab-GTPase-TBC domain-containing protein [Blastocladiella britannica]